MSLTLKKLKLSLVLIIVLFFLSFIIHPSVNFHIGNIFFGGVPKLYNVNLAQYFYTYASYPLVGEAVPFAHYQLSRTYFIKGELEIALAEAERELIQYPENTRTYYILGLTYGYLNREEEAIAAFGRFIEFNPLSWAARNDRAWLQFRIGDIAGALETIEPVSVMQNPWIQNTYGTLLLNAGKKDEARQVFLRAREIISSTTEEEWGSAYPGNDPRIYKVGLSAMKNSIDENLLLLEK